MRQWETGVPASCNLDMPYVYMLECADGSFYVGSARDLGTRVSEHMAGTGAKYTRRKCPVHLVWAEEVDRVDDAYFLEKQVQGWSREKRVALMKGRYADLPRLSKRGRRVNVARISSEVRDRLRGGGII